eukprot:1913011-Prymnesium_polylepis.1
MWPRVAPCDVAPPWPRVTWHRRGPLVTWRRRGPARALAIGCDVVVATPGRLLDFIGRQLVSLEVANVARCPTRLRARLPDCHRCRTARCLALTRRLPPLPPWPA